MSNIGKSPLPSLLPLISPASHLFSSSSSSSLPSSLPLLLLLIFSPPIPSPFPPLLLLFLSSLFPLSTSPYTVRLEETFDMSTTVKFAYIHWSGKEVPFAKRGKYGVVHGSIEKYFDVSEGTVQA